MSTLVLTLAAMVVPGNGPETVSGEMEQALDLRGEWVGYEWDEWRTIWAMEVRRGELSGRSLLDNALFFPVLFQMVDEGGGKLRFLDRLGIYQQDGERLIICLGRFAIHEHPKFFRGGEGQELLILRRVKPRK